MTYRHGRSTICLPSILVPFNIPCSSRLRPGYGSANATYIPPTGSLLVCPPLAAAPHIACRPPCTSPVMICLSAFTALYTMKGGLRAVVYADMVQGTWLILSAPSPRPTHQNRSR